MSNGEKRIRALDWEPPDVVENVNNLPDTPEVSDWLESEAIVAVYRRHLRNAARIPNAAASYLRAVTGSRSCEEIWTEEPGDRRKPFIDPPQGDDIEWLLVPTGRLDPGLSGPGLVEARLGRIHQAVLALGEARGWRLSGVHAAAQRARAELHLPGGDPQAQPDLDEPWPEQPQVSEQFWRWIDTLSGRVDEASARALANDLRGAGAEAIERFQVDLTLAEQKLATPAHYRRRIVDVDEGVVSLRSSRGDDEFFDYVRGAVIAAGQQEWQRVVDEPRTLSEPRSVLDGSWLGNIPAILAGDFP